jgi:hypothetical protein
VRDVLFIVRSLFAVIARERSWWMAPVVVGLLLIAGLTLAATITPVAPFLYPLF